MRGLTSAGGSVTQDKDVHFNDEGVYHVRWWIVDGPAGTKDVTVRASLRAGASATGTLARSAEMRTLLWR
jgi:hypothetical protein